MSQLRALAAQVPKRIPSIVQICIGAMHPQAIAARDTNMCDRMPALQFLGVCRWGLSTQKTARIRREQLNILHQKESEAAAMASMSPTASANVQGTHTMILC